MSGHRLISTTPNTFFYAATKFAVTALTEGVRRELREIKSNVKVTVRRIKSSIIVHWNHGTFVSLYLQV